MSEQVTTIVSGDESEIHDEPHLRGRRLTVRQIQSIVEGQGLDPQTVADRFDLSVSDVYHALAYYHDHPEEMRIVEERREERHATARGDPDVATGPSDAPSEP